jgi:hypothetical protein
MIKPNAEIANQMVGFLYGRYVAARSNMMTASSSSYVCCVTTKSRRHSTMTTPSKKLSINSEINQQPA